MAVAAKPLNRRKASRPLTADQLSRKGAMGQALANDTGRADAKLRKFSWEQDA